MSLKWVSVRSIVVNSIAVLRWAPAVLTSACKTSSQTGCADVIVIASIVVIGPIPNMVFRVGKQSAETSVV